MIKWIHRKHLSSAPLHLEEKRKKDKQEKAAIIFPSRKWEKGREEWGNEKNGQGLTFPAKALCQRMTSHFTLWRMAFVENVTLVFRFVINFKIN